jgi:hypothetical protein
METVNRPSDLPETEVCTARSFNSRARRIAAGVERIGQTYRVDVKASAETIRYRSPALWSPSS